jgi:hypothetical protein
MINSNLSSILISMKQSLKAIEAEVLHDDDIHYIRVFDNKTDN